MIVPPFAPLSVPIAGNVAAMGKRSSLLNNLVFYARLDEASGTRVDVVGGNDLTDNNTVTQAAGVLGTDFAAQFTRANSEYLSHVDNASLSTGNIDFTWAAWVYMDSKPADLMYISAKEDLAATTEWVLRWNNVPDRFEFYIGGSSFVGVAADALGAPSTATWYLVIGWFDSVGQTVNIQVNNGTVNSAATGGVAPSDTAIPVYIGAYTQTPSRYWDGRVARVGFWKSAAGAGGVLTAAQRTNLYGGGSPPDYPFVGIP